ncbi:hypothetical protein QFW77_01140 [Luteimonas sp. RD2P54]|uniref:Uncharacterized protein n=1 Tax=Luteimonas endophytica TaxID=3042023 RepID=A0ABT6J499_9GAMM|nr:hypothetical protein [Luteimonas endophytica]MDH5821599.1 hypothetical protein [Luteimonas endophytica]
MKARAGASPRRQRGAGLLQALLVVLAIGAALAAAAVLLHAPKPARQATTQEQALAWADEAVMAFAAANARLPCPADEVHGAENCAAGNAKGWLPLRSLAGAAGNGRGIGPMRYMAYRGGGAAPDLAVAQNRYSPVDLAGDARDFDAVNGLDFCRMLADAQGVGVDASAAHVLDRGGTPMNVAYGIAAAGPDAGVAGRLDDRNASDSVVMEAPWRRGDADYDDRVRVRDLRELGHALGCRFARPDAPDNVALASVDLLSGSVTVAETVEEFQEFNRANAEVSLAFAIVNEVFAVSAVALASANLSNSISTLATASAQLSAAIAACALPPWAQCALIPVYSTAVGLAVAAVATSGAAIAANAAALAVTSGALAATTVAYQMATGEVGGGSQADYGELADTVCTSAHGGMVPVLDGNHQPVPGQFVWQDGLEQQLVPVQAEVAVLETRVAIHQAVLDDWAADPSAKIEYARHGVDPSDPDQAGAAALLNTRLQENLQAIRRYEDLRLAYEQGVETAEAAKRVHDDAVASALHMETVLIPQACADIQSTVDQYRCDSYRKGLADLRECGNPAVKCIATMHQEWQDAVAARDQARAERDQQRQRLGNLHDVYVVRYNLSPCPVADDPDIGAYSPYCRVLHILDQPDWDPRRPYGWHARQFVAQNAALERKREELAELQERFDTAAQQCIDLRAIAGAPPGTPVPGVDRWENAEDILRAADWRGAVGPVAPEDAP